MLTDLVRLFPDLPKEGYLRTSDPSIDYNCVAWAAGDDKQWWEPDRMGLFHWPAGVRREWNTQSLSAVFQAQKYILCADGTHEHGYEKIAIYAKQGVPTHVARQLPGGRWTSKLGPLDDITHTLDGLAGKEYGQPHRFLRRQLSL